MNTLWYDYWSQQSSYTRYCFHILFLKSFKNQIVNNLAGLKQTLRVCSRWFKWIKFVLIVMVRWLQSHGLAVGWNFSVRVKNYPRSRLTCQTIADHLGLLLSPMQVLPLARIYIRLPLILQIIGHWDTGFTIYMFIICSYIYTCSYFQTWYLIIYYEIHVIGNMYNDMFYNGSLKVTAWYENFFFIDVTWIRHGFA